MAHKKQSAADFPGVGFEDAVLRVVLSGGGDFADEDKRLAAQHYAVLAMHPGDVDETGGGAGKIIADLEQFPDAERFANLFATARDLLQIAESAANAFQERISCLKDELREDFCDADDINDQIGNYEWLLDQHRKVISKAKGQAS